MVKIRMTNRNSSLRNGGLKRRIEMISSRTFTNGYALAEVSRGLDADSASQLQGFVTKQLSPQPMFNVTSVEDLRNWANVRGRCNLGRAIAFDVPVVCTGFLARDKDSLELASQVLGREVKDNIHEHERVSAHGVSFGSTFVKTFKGTNADGTQFVKEIATVTLCNLCLEHWVGPRKEDGTRSTKLWKFAAPPVRDDKPNRSAKKHERRERSGSKRKSPKPAPSGKGTQHSSSKGLPFILKNVQSSVSPTGRERDPFNKVTVTQLTSYLKDVGAYPNGKARKETLVAALQQYLKVNEPTKAAEISRIISNG